MQQNYFKTGQDLKAVKKYEQEYDDLLLKMRKSTHHKATSKNLFDGTES